MTSLVEVKENISWISNISADVDGTHGSICTDNTSLEEMQIFLLVNWYLEGILQICISFAGLLSNCIAIPVLLSQELRNRFYVTLAVLAVFDAVYNFLDILESIRKHHYDYGNEDTCGAIPYHITFHEYMFYRLLFPLQAIVMMSSIYCTVIVAFERYIAVSRPISAFVQDGGGSWKKVFIYILPMLAFTILFNAPKFLEFCARIENIEQECPYSENITFRRQCTYNETTTVNSRSILDNIGEPFSRQQCNYLIPLDLNPNGILYDKIS